MRWIVMGILLAGCSGGVELPDEPAPEAAEGSCTGDALPADAPEFSRLVCEEGLVVEDGVLVCRYSVACRTLWDETEQAGCFTYRTAECD